MLEYTLICRSRSGNQNQRTAVDKDIYQKTLLVTGITSALYILPLVGIFLYTYVYHSGSTLSKDSHSKIIANATLFATWISQTLNDTSEGVSLLFSFVLHLFIITFLISLSTIASYIRSEEKNISQIREAHRQETKNGLELNQIKIIEQTNISMEAESQNIEEQSKLINK